MKTHCMTRSRQAGRVASTVVTGSWLLAIAATSPLHAQQVGTTVLKAPLTEHPEPLTQPTAVLELRDGRVLVADTKDRLLYLYDFAAGTATQVSRQGSGPLEYQLPAGLFASGDSIIVMDMLQQRLLVLDTKGAPRGTHRLVPTGDATSAILKLGTLLAIDAKGRFYSETRGITIVQGKMPTMSDTVALVRWASLGGRGDTLALRVEKAPMPKMAGNPNDGISFKLSMTAFQPRDTWAVFPDGRVAVARSSDYHTEWIDVAGHMTPGPKVAYTPLPVTEGDKARARKATRDAAEQGMKLGASMAAGSGQKMPKIKMDVEEPDAWPKVKPPFGQVRAAPDGRLWVSRSVADAGEIMEYDILAPGGKLVGRVRTPRDVTLLGFGKGVVYGVRKDADDLRYLQRYKFP